MKNRIIICFGLIFFIFINSQQSLSQKLGNYKLKSYTLNKGYIVYSLTLYKNNLYEFENLDINSDDFFYSKYISYGFFTKKGDTLIFNDKLNSFKILALYKNDSITLIKSFKWLLNKTYTFNSEIEDSIPSSLMFKEFSYSLQKQNKYYNDSYNEIFKLRLGKYNTIGEWYDELYLMPDKTYKLIFKRIVLSEGTWKRDKNIIELWDISLKHSFYLLIKRDGTLESRYVPGDYEGEIFYYHKE